MVMKPNRRGAPTARPDFDNRTGVPMGSPLQVGLFFLFIIFAFIGCDHPERVDIGALVEALQSLDHDVAVDGDEINTDDDGVVCEEGEKVCEGNWVMRCEGGGFVQFEECVDCGALCQCAESAGNAWCEHTDPGPDDADMADKDVVEAEVDEDLVEADLSAEAEAEVDDDSSAEAEAEADVVTDIDIVMQSNVICSGQTKCYDNTAEITCPAEGSDYYGQDAQYVTLDYCVSRDYTVTGTIPEEIVIDNNTGLEWQRTLPATYDGCTGGGPVGKLCGLQEAQDYCANLSYGSFNDWRLPTRKELTTLADYGQDSPAIDSSVFPNTPAEYFWTDSSLVSDSVAWWFVVFSDGYIGTFDKTGSVARVRCVRGAALSAHLFSESTIEDKIAVVDHSAGLTWTKEESATALTWQAALSYCEDLSYAGSANWRLPNIEELISLVNTDVKEPASDFPGMGSYSFWSSTSKDGSSSDAWIIFFNTGGVADVAKTQEHAVRCVHNATLTRTTKQWGRTTGQYYGTAVVLDANGNIFVAGTASGTLDGSTTSGPIFLTKFTPDLTKEWTKQWGSGVEAWSHGAAVDSGGNIYVTGTARGDFDGNTQIGGDDIFLTRWNANGTKAWSKLLGTTSTSSMYEEGYAIAINNSDEIFTSGDVGASIDGGTYIGNYDVFLGKYLGDGEKQWIKQYGTDDWDITYSMAQDNAGNLYMVGSTRGSLSGYTNAGADDLFLMKTSGSGIESWHREWGTSGVDRAWGVAVDSNDNIYVTGETGGDLDGNTSAGNSDIFLTKWNSDGTKAWTKQWGNDQPDTGSAVVVDKNGFIFVTGAANGSLDGNPDAGAGDVFLTKWSPSGTKIWTKQWGSSGNDWGRAMAIDDNGKIFITGSSGGLIDGNLDSDNTDIFLSVFE
ncbi:MAG TPA: DUF1566 domain-containing protein [bacterium]|nr:DUF1566 domain-containing protein [bacterium]